MNKTRLESFSDGVFAIAITLLALGVRLPESAPASNEALAGNLAGMLPSLLTYMFTFLVVGVFWVAHHRIFGLAKRLDATLMWVNIAYLMAVAIIPVPAAILARSPLFQSAILFYTGTLFVVSSLHFVFLAYIYRHPELREAHFTPELLATARRTASVGPCCYLGAAISSYFAPALSFAFVLAALVFYIFFANRVRLFRTEAARGEAAGPSA